MYSDAGKPDGMSATSGFEPNDNPATVESFTLKQEILT